MRKFISIAILLYSLSSSLYATDGYFVGEGGKGQRILMYSSTIENGSKSDNWLSAKVKRDILNDFVNFSNIDIIDAEERATVLKLQKASESVVYDEKDPIVLGKLLQAKKYIKLVTTRKKDTYVLAAIVTNVETGKTEASFTSKFYTESDFVNNAHGEVSASILQQLGVQLTTAGKRLLEYGTFSQTESESKETLSVYEAELKRLEQEQLSLKAKHSSDIDAQAQQARIEVQKATILQQQKNEESRLQRLQADEKRRQEEERISKERDVATQKRILSLSNEIEKKAAELRSKKIAGMSAMQQIEIIEGEKQILATNEREIATSRTSFNAEQDAACEKEVAARKQQKPRMTDIDAQGNLTSSAKQNLESDIQAIRLKYENLKANNNSLIKNTVEKTQEQLREKISADVKKLEEQIFTVDSLYDKNLFFRIGNYNGEKQGWEYTLAFFFEGIQLYMDTGFLTYKEITGEDIPVYPTATASNRDKKMALYKIYQDNVETYDSFFRLNVPYIQVILSYKILAGDVSEASLWNLKIEKLSFLSVKTGKLIQNKSIMNQELKYFYTPRTLVNWHKASQRRKIKNQIRRRETKEVIAQGISRPIKWLSKSKFPKTNIPSIYPPVLPQIGFGNELIYTGGRSDIAITPWLFLNGMANFLRPLNETEISSQENVCIGIGLNRGFGEREGFFNIFYNADIGVGRVVEGTEENSGILFLQTLGADLGWKFWSLEFGFTSFMYPNGKMYNVLFVGLNLPFDYHFLAKI